MRRFPADPGRRVHVEGVGDVPRPTDVDAAATGFTRLRSLRVDSLSAGQVVRGEAEDDEVCVVVLDGRATLEVRGPTCASFAGEGRSSPFEGEPLAVYLPPGHGYVLTVHEDAEVAYARAQAAGRFGPRALTAALEGVGTGAAEHERRALLAPGDAEHLRCEELRIPSGHWRFAADARDLDALAYYRLRPPTGFALHRAGREVLVLADRDTVASERVGDVLAVPPGGDLYALRVTAGAD